jgi:hypothetical protein
VYVISTDDLMSAFQNLRRPLIPAYDGEGDIDDQIASAQLWYASEVFTSYLDEMRRLANSLVEIYLGADSTQRSICRTCAAQTKTPPTASLICDHLPAIGAGDASALRKAAALASVFDPRCRSRETIVALDEIYVAAADAGIDAQTVFAEVADISSKESDAGNVSMAELLGDFAWRHE